MPEPSPDPFDPSSFFEFDLRAGAVRARLKQAPAGQRVMVITEASLAPLVTAAVEGGNLRSMRKLGRELGRFAAASLGASPISAPAAHVLEHAAGVLAVFGFGTLVLEPLGDGVIVRLSGGPALDEGQLTMAALLGGLVSELSAEEVACVPVAEPGAFLVLHPSIAEEVWGWALEGSSLAAIIEALGGASP